MMRKHVATACVTLALALALAGCSGDPFGDADGKRIKAAVEGLFGELERADYTAAAAHWCTDEPPAKPQTAEALAADFGSYPRPWKIKLTSAQYTSDGTGNVNLTLTDGAGAEHQHNVDLNMAGNTARICNVDDGTVHIDVEI